MFEKLINDLENNKCVEVAAIALLEEMKRRIFVDGYNASESEIGSYVSDWYKRERQKRGLQTGYVDLKFTGKLEKDFTLIKRNGKVFGFGFVTDRSAALADNLENRYGKVFELSESETELFYQYFNDCFGKIFE